ncbi:MAG: hypothetical protein HPY87_10275 [Fervidobacterium sp.]|uniref:hypothetical protein n=1 Tax=Fervidobacterium sp. TaxID=1871331 RepID=UPI0025B9EE2C|nr:hypothetical protein [Fervidobacterium sp.]NPU90244.1 hypothetical protein [Fervidobacterium sp.]
MKTYKILMKRDDGYVSPTSYYTWHDNKAIGDKRFLDTKLYGKGKGHCAYVWSFISPLNTELIYYYRYAYPRSAIVELNVYGDIRVYKNGSVSSDYAEVVRELPLDDAIPFANTIGNLYSLICMYDNAKGNTEVLSLAMSIIDKTKRRDMRAVRDILHEHFVSTITDYLIDEFDRTHDINILKSFVKFVIHVLHQKQSDNNDERGVYYVYFAYKDILKYANTHNKRDILNDNGIMLLRKIALSNPHYAFRIAIEDGEPRDDTRQAMLCNAYSAKDYAVCIDKCPHPDTMRVMMEHEHIMILYMYETKNAIKEFHEKIISCGNANTLARYYMLYKTDVILNPDKELFHEVEQAIISIGMKDRLDKIAKDDEYESFKLVQYGCLEM